MRYNLQGNCIRGIALLLVSSERWVIFSCCVRYEYFCEKVKYVCFVLQITWLSLMNQKLFSIFGRFEEHSVESSRRGVC